MKKFLLTLCAIFMCIGAYAKNITLNWIVDGEQYGTPTMCEYSGDVILPTPPTKYGYTFAGWEPNEYLFVEYIQGLNNTQYIDTEIVPTSDMSYYGKFGFVSDTQHNANFCFGVRVKNKGIVEKFGIYGFVHENYIGLDFFQVNKEAGRYIINNPRNTNDVYEFYINNLNAIVKKNDVIIGEHSFTESGFINYNLFLNALAENDQITYSNVNSVINRIYHFKIEGIADMRPAIRLSDNAVGMYDVIRQRFFENAGTGAFTAGPVINE